MIKYAPLPGSENMYPGVHGAKATCQRLTLGLFNRIYILQTNEAGWKQEFSLDGILCAYRRRQYGSIEKAYPVIG